MPVLLDMLMTYGWATDVLDPFAGIGGIHWLREFGYVTTGVELEPEWALQSPHTIIGDATALPFGDKSFRNVVTSPCLEQSQRILTNDLRWLPVGEIEEGQEILAFEEVASGVKVSGMASRRRWQRGTVLRSVPKTVECVRVMLSNGDEIITTPEHPWLAARYSYGPAEWVESRALLGKSGLGRTRGHRGGARQAYFALKQVSPWSSLKSYDAGWLAGIFDGEGSLSLGVHGSPRMAMCQVRKGFPGILKALGELRPVRLLKKWETLDIGTRTVEAKKIKVVAIESVGLRDIQEIETSTGTYIGEGYLHHNCYGNRMADHHDAKDDSYRRTYRHSLGHPLARTNAGGLQWGTAYKLLHEMAWQEAVRVLKPDGLFILNIKDHQRHFKRMHVSNWHHQTLTSLGLYLVDLKRVGTPHFGYGENRQYRYPERVLTYRKFRVHTARHVSCYH